MRRRPGRPGVRAQDDDTNWLSRARQARGRRLLVLVAWPRATQGHRALLAAQRSRGGSLARAPGRRRTDTTGLVHEGASRREWRSGRPMGQPRPTNPACIGHARLTAPCLFTLAPTLSVLRTPAPSPQRHLLSLTSQDL